jgi:hypothetical protein
MTEAEVIAQQRLESEGYMVLRRGWPDFIATRGDETRLIEVKANDSCLTIHQKRVHEALEKLNLKVEVLRIKVQVGTPERQAFDRVQAHEFHTRENAAYRALQKLGLDMDTANDLCRADFGFLDWDGLERIETWIRYAAGDAQLTPALLVEGLEGKQYPPKAPSGYGDIL